MGWIEGIFKRTGGESAAFQTDGGTDDYALSRKMRAVALEIQTEGRAALRLERSALQGVREALEEAEGLRSGCIDGGAALERLCQDARMMESCAEQARVDRVRALPASGGRARIAIVMDALCSKGDVRLSKERLQLALASFDDVQALEMAELWAVPEAVRVSLTRAYLRTVRRVIETARERQLAERWVEGKGVSLSHRSPAFFEYALQLLTEREDGALRSELEKHLTGAGSSVEQEVQAAHSRDSVLRMRLENLMDNKRLIDAIDWQECFEQLSAVESELRYDPTEIYPAMEDDSRAAVREQVSVLARRLRVSELTVARHAVSAAQSAAQDSAPKAQRTVCYWLYSDEGRAALVRRMGMPAGRIPLLTPDPTGRRAVWGIAILFGLAYALYLKAVPSLLFLFLGIPPAWSAAMALLGRMYPRLIKPARLLKLKIDSVPDALRTLVVMPVLLSSKQRAEEICDQFEALGCMERDANIRYLILGDFSDADEEHMPDDTAIVDLVNERIARMNARAGREQYFYLHRERRFLEADRKWMGRDRKRGALMSLNRLLLGENGAEDAFRAEGRACRKLCEGYRYVLTIDADTRFLPGAVQRLIGTLVHPLNAAREEGGERVGYAVLQPQMEMTARACVNGFVKLFAGSGGLNTYPTSVSNFWQDVTGTGIFGGKGLYDVRAFHRALDGALPEGKILSHDLIEGTLAGAALVSDVCFYDGYPATLSGYMRRLNRWTRGDWQLLPQLLGAKKYPNGRRLSIAERTRLLDNLLRSLYAPSLLAMLIQSIWLGNMNALIAGLLFAFIEPVLDILNGARPRWRRAMAELAILPVTAACTSDAIIRTLWRLAFSGKHLLDWVPSADAEAMPGGTALSSRLAAILVLPGLFLPGWIPAAVAFAALFAVAPEWIRDMEETQIDQIELPDGHQTALLMELARDTWRFFEESVTADSGHLPPDNVQVDPDVGPARRTSPTNIGLYLMSCLSARALGFIGEEELSRRMEDAVGTIERLEKWKGHLFNWYDTEALCPLNPRYVSSVDSGNFAAALLLCASAVEERMPELSERMRSIAVCTDFSALYDKERDLFVIGCDVERGRLSESHYDLLASEARILSYTAMMLGHAPLRHWSRLARTATNVHREAALISWSGTMFEYLMPELFMHAPENTLLGGAMRAAIRAQRALGERRQRPWGVSESGYYAFDLHLNYQYRAFGLRELSLGGSTPEDVVAPYASVMAAFAAPDAVAKNVSEMKQAGWYGGFGLYEAADYLRAGEDGRPRLVKSYMAHHQGMALCALCNALTGRTLSCAFQRIPEARALELLLEEKTVPAVRLSRRGAAASGERRVEGRARDDRPARPEARVSDAHLLGGAGATALLTADGAAHYQRNGVQGTRFGGDLLNRNDGACVHLRRESTGEEAVFGGKNVIYEPGGATMTCALSGVTCTLRLCVSPEDGALIKRVTLRNNGEAAELVRVADCAPVALGSPSDMLAHPVFRHLFVESERIAKGALLFRRRPREKDEGSPLLVHLVSTPGSISCETDFERLAGRTGSTMRPGGIRWEMTDSVGTVLNPCSALQSAVTVPPGQSVEIHFAFGLMDANDTDAWLRRNFAETAPERAGQLAAMQARAMLGFLGLEPRRHQLLQRLAALLFDGHFSALAQRVEAQPVSRESLWGLGISGDLPILSMCVHRKEETAAVRELVRAHEFYRTLGVSVDLVLVNEHGNDYDQPVRDAIGDVLAFSHLNDLRGRPGGVHLLDAQALTQQQAESLRRASAVNFDGGQDFYVQLRRALSVLDVPRRDTKVMETGANRLAPMRTGNSYGGFLADGRYAIDVRPDRVTPAPWSNLMANESFGMLLTERGGGFIWNGNSRSGRLTAFANDVLCEGWGWMLYLVDEENHTWVRLLPGDRPHMPFRTLYGKAETVYRFETERLSGEVALCVRDDAPELRIHTTLRSSRSGGYRLVGFADWLMGTNARDSGLVRTWSRDGACFAVGSMQGVGYFAASNARVHAGCDRTAFLGRGSILNPEGICDSHDRAGGWVLNVPVQMQADVPLRTDWTLGLAGEPQQAYARVRSFYAQPEYEAVRSRAHREWNERMERMVIETPDGNVNRMANGWLTHQTLTSRIRGRTGLYQPGGAYGFRDQLQDMLSLLPFEPARVRAHILRSAARQFEDGDVMHWWHEPFLGVRTRIRDDLLFLPYVTAKYVRWTQDVDILDEHVHYLKNVEIETGKEDRFCEMQPGLLRESLHGHCMRALRRAASLGEHGLALMGCGDWNDGMNRVGDEGRGESIWLTEFLSACATEYAEIAPDEADRAWLTALADQLNAAIERHGWDGGWYLRAYTDEGETLGGAESPACRLDAISQAWAVLAGLDRERCRRAMDAAWRMLVNEDIGIIRLLTPPFTVDGPDPGYIRGYPEGVRENGAQYTHGACWLLLALIRMGDAERAHRALQMLLPMNHSDTKDKADVYRVEPYVLAADVYDGAHPGRGGWTWYTGSAAWLYQCILELLGFERQGNRVRLCALLGEWPEAAVTVRFGGTKYKLICKKAAEAATLDGTPVDGEWIEMQDDGLFHEAVFPARSEEENMGKIILSGDLQRQFQ